MDISEKVNHLKKRLGLTAALTIAAASASFAGNNNTPEADNNKIDTVTQTLNNDSIKKYLNVVEISSADQLADYDVATYNRENNAIICNFFVLSENTTKADKKAVQERNLDALSSRTHRHEKFHGDVIHIMDKAYNGEAPVNFGDRTRLNILQELCAFYKGEEHTSMAQTVQYFKQKKFEDHYLRHYQDNKSGSILLAMMAEPIYQDAEKLLETTYTNRHKNLEIDGKTYVACNYTDGKVQTNLLFTENDDPVVGKNILEKVPSEYEIGIVKDMNGNILKDSQGAPLTASYLKWSDGKTLLASRDPGKKSIRGYTMTQAKLNYKKIAKEICTHAGMNEEDIMNAMNYLSTLNVDYNNLNTKEITEIREMYAGTSIESLKQKTKTNYEEGLAAAKLKKTNQYAQLISFENVNLISPNDLKSINIDALSSKIIKTSLQKNASR